MEDQGLNKFGWKTNNNLIPVDPTDLQEVYTKYVKYPTRIVSQQQYHIIIWWYIKTLSRIYTTLVVRTSTYTGMYFQMKKNIQKFCTIYLQKGMHLRTSFKNMYYKFSYNNNGRGQYKGQAHLKNKNSLKNIELRRLRRTRIFWFWFVFTYNWTKILYQEVFDPRNFPRTDSSTKPLRYDFSTGDRTYETALATARQSHSTVGIQNSPNSKIYFCSMWTVDLLGTFTNLCNCPLSRICPRCALRFTGGGKRIFRRPCQMKLYETRIDVYGTDSL